MLYSYFEFLFLRNKPFIATTLNLNTMSKNFSRREFIQKSAIATAGVIAASSSLLASVSGTNPVKNKKAPSTKKLNVVGIGVGGRGGAVISELAGENILALCDVDWKYASKKFKEFPNAKLYKDYRVMFAEIGDQIDAVVIGTADHTHAVIAAQALAMGKHVYCEKPLTHTVYETRLLTKLAKKQKVATQMGNQGASGEGVRKTCEAIWSGMIGEVTKVEAFTDRPIWPQGLETPKSVDIPNPELDWNLFIGPAKFRPFNEIYHPWNWRGWWDFGTGALGDMACHILQPVVQALALNSPTSVQGSSTNLMVDSAPNAQIVKYVFPARDNMPRVSMPQVEVTWYDGGLMPEYPKGWPLGKSMNDGGGAVIFHGTKDTLVCGCYGANPWLISGREMPTPTMTREVPEHNHIKDFSRACKESAEDRVLTASDFSKSGPLNEMVVMGVMAVRLQGLNRELKWDGEKMCFTNINPDDTIKIKIKDGFSIKEGHPSFNNEYTAPINALAFANEMIRHTYQNGYSLPEMP